MADRFYSWFRICAAATSDLVTLNPLQRVYFHMFFYLSCRKIPNDLFSDVGGKGKKKKHRSSTKNKSFISSARDWIVCALYTREGNLLPNQNYYILMSFMIRFIKKLKLIKCD